MADNCVSLSSGEGGDFDEIAKKTLETADGHYVLLHKLQAQVEQINQAVRLQ